MNRILLSVLSLSAALLAAYCLLRPARPGKAVAPAPVPVSVGRPVPEKASPAAAGDAAATAARRSAHARDLAAFARRNGYSANVAFLADMRLPSGRARFFIHDLRRDSVLAAGLVAHGNCNSGFLETASFSSEPGCGCSSLGRYKVGYAYNGSFGKAFKLHGLDASNRTAYARFVVLHAYRCVPDEELYPAALCNSLGCPMLSHKFLETAAGYIRREKKPVLLWIYQ